MHRQWLAILAFGLGFAACKDGAVMQQETPKEKPRTAVTEESSAMLGEAEDGDLVATGESQDTAITPILVTGTYLTCLDLPVSKNYDYQERGRVIGCRLTDKQTGQPVAMERVASDWRWQSQAASGVVVHERLNNDSRALYPLVLELKGLSPDGKDILETVVKLTLDLILAVDGKTSIILTVVLNQILQAIPSDSIEDEVIFPQVANSITQPPVEAANQDQQNVQQGEITEASGPENGDEDDLGSEASEESELPEKVKVRFELEARPGGVRISMLPVVQASMNVSDESLRITGEVIAESETRDGESLLYGWRCPVDVTFRLNDQVTCQGQGLVGSSAREVTVTCQ